MPPWIIKIQLYMPHSLSFTMSSCTSLSLLHDIYLFNTNSVVHLCLGLQVKSRQLWGEDIYTDDSDLVAVLLHLGYYASNNTASNPLVARFYAQVWFTAAARSYMSCKTSFLQTQLLQTQLPADKAVAFFCAFFVRELVY
jgi:hypothetical protein